MAYQLWSKTSKNGRTYRASAGVDIQTIFFFRRRSWSSGFLHTFISAAARGQDNEFLLISILLSYLFPFFVNQFSYYMFCKNEIVVPLFPYASSLFKKEIRSDYLILQKFF